MSEVPHRQIAVETFNSTWELIDLRERTPDQTEEMIHRSHASFWHWSQVEEHTATNLSVGAWQLARVYALAGAAERALHYAQQSLDLARDNELGPFYVGYAFEALARAAAIAGDKSLAETYAASAAAEAEKIISDEYRQPILDDLATI